MLIKTIHLVSAALSFGGFVLRGFWMLRASPLLAHKLTRILPHIVDTVLLGSAILLAINIHQYPGVHGWLTAKVLALLAYIVLGSIALKRGRTRTIRITAWLAAMLVFLYIVSVALTRSPVPGMPL